MPKAEWLGVAISYWRVISLSALTVLVLNGCAGGRAKINYDPEETAGWATARGGDHNAGLSSEGSLAALDTLLWRVETGGLPAAEPVVRGGLLFHCGLDRRVEVFEIVSGRKVFRKRFDAPVLGLIAGDSTLTVLLDQPERRLITLDLKHGRQIHSIRVPTPGAPPRALSDTLILLAGWNGHLLCVSHRGATVWDATCEGPIQHPPAIADSVIYVASGRSIFALNARDGATLWEHGVGGVIEGGPAIAERVYFGAADSFVTALDPAGSVAVWTRRLDGAIFSTPAISSDSLIYVAANNGLVYALRKSTGETVWSYDTGALANLSPTVSGLNLIVASRSPKLVLLDKNDGHEVASTALRHPASISPIAVGSLVFVSDDEHSLYCFGPKTR